jgi:hypothetical protein
MPCCMLYCNRRSQIAGSLCHQAGLMAGYYYSFQYPPEDRNSIYLVLLARSMIYFLADMPEVVRFERKAKEYLIHHLAAIITILVFMILPSSLLDLFLIHLFIEFEVSTVFLNLYYLAQQNASLFPSVKRILVLFTGTLFTLSFFLCRFVLFSRRMWHLYFYLNETGREWLKPFLLLAIPFLILNSWWGKGIIAKWRRFSA